MGYEVGYARKKKAQPCSQGGKILTGQLRFTVKKNARRKHPNGQDLVGYNTLTPQDKARVNDFFGWNQEEDLEEVGLPDWKSQQSLPSAIASPSVRAEPVSDYDAQEPSAAPALAEPPLDDILGIWDTSIPSNGAFENQDQGQQLGQVDNGDLSSLYDQLSSLTFRPLKPTAAVGATDQVKYKYHSNGLSGSGQRRETPTNDLWLMQLELEEKEARVRLANAELEVAKSHAKAEAARHAVIEQKLRMARAGFLRDDPVMPVM
ncbi:hypothetical protein FRC04_004072 [Tulasnella sp. 424]|nr:hypothetical protein FRC04_004072 [Tulasnella sp. 424]